MKSLAAGAGFLAVLMLANVVAAGVFAVLGPLVLELADGDWQVVAMVLVMLLAIGCALAFLKGCLRFVVDHLQCRSSRRGG